MLSFMTTFMDNLAAMFKIIWWMVGIGIGLIFVMAIWMSVFDYIKDRLPYKR